MKSKILRHSFVKYIPETLEDDVIYISIDYCTATHTCMCGCGSKVVTPITPLDWALTFDGETVSLSPSIGNWNFDCQSHYWIKQGRVEWAGKWSKNKIDSGRENDKVSKRQHFEQINLPVVRRVEKQIDIPMLKQPTISLFGRVISKLRLLLKM